MYVSRVLQCSSSRLPELVRRHRFIRERERER